MSGDLPYRASVVVLLTAALTATATRVQRTIHVDESAGGPHNGSSWCEAYTELYEALEEAASGDTIRVAGGIYLPDTTGLNDSHDATFQLISGVRIEGGYAGCGEPDPDARDVTVYETVLSGDLNGDDAPNESNCCREHSVPGCDDTACQTAVCAVVSSCCSAMWGATCTELAEVVCPELCGGRSENSFHVVTASDTDATSALDGFTITGGHAHGNLPGSGDGGGVYNNGGSCTLIDCTFQKNSAGSGGGMYNGNGADPTLTYCTFRDNFAQHGGGTFNDASSPIMNQCTWRGNVAGDTGGGMCNWNGSRTTLTNCIFEGNTTEDWGGGMCNRYGSLPTLTECTFRENMAQFGGGMTNWESDSILEDCTFIGNVAGSTGGGMVNHASDPTVTRSRFLDNSAGFYGGGMANLNDAGPTIFNSIFNANSAGYGGAIRNDWSRATLINCTFASNSAVGRVLSCNSFQQQYPSHVEMINCILWNGSDEIRNVDGSTILVNYSDVHGGWPGIGNHDVSPRFVDPDGADGIPGNEDDDLRLLPGSPCINTGDPAFVPDSGAVDVAGEPRLQGCRVDRGAYESDIAQMPGDFDADDNIDLADYAFLQNCFSRAAGNPEWLDTCLCVFDDDGSGDIDLADFADFAQVMDGP